MISCAEMCYTHIFMDLKKSRIHNYDLVSHNFSISMFVDFLFFGKRNSKNSVDYEPG